MHARKIIEKCGMNTTNIVSNDEINSLGGEVPFIRASLNDYEGTQKWLSASHFAQFMMYLLEENEQHFDRSLKEPIGRLRKHLQEIIK